MLLNNILLLVVIVLLYLSNKKQDEIVGKIEYLHSNIKSVEDIGITLHEYLLKQENKQIKQNISDCLIFLHNRTKGRFNRLNNETDEQYLDRLQSYVEHIEQIKNVIEEPAMEWVCTDKEEN